MKQTIALLCVALLVGACNGTGTELTATVQTQGSPDEVAVLETKFGKIVIEFANEDAPKTVANFKKLAKQGYYNGTTFHRVIPNFMIQGGDPNTKLDPHSPRAGTGGPGYTVPAEIKLPNARGAVACARTGDNVNPKKASSGSQFFINLKDNTFLDQAGYTVFGRVLKGIEAADLVVSQPRNEKDNPDDPIRMEIKIVPRAEAGL